MQIVIDIPERIHYGIEKGITVNGSEASQILIDAVKNGIPLEDVKAEIENLTYYLCEVRPRSVIDDVLKILDNIGKESEEKPNE